MKMNYQRELDRLLGSFSGKPPSLLLHSCCAPCSSYVLQYLSQYFSITLLYYNPNIEPAGEYQKRVEEQKRLIQAMPLANPVVFIEGCYEPEAFHRQVRGLEACPEGGDRCKACFRLRLHEAARFAKELGCDYFTTTLTISPLKNAEVINEIGSGIGKEFGVAFLPSDFKKKDGYKISIQLSKEYNLYRQDYCGCVYSRRKLNEEV